MRHPLVAIVSSRLGSFGDTGTSESQVALARNAAFGDPAFEDCFVEVPNRSLTTGVDGRPWRRRLWRFRIGVDASARVLQLTPFDDPAALLDGSHGAAVHRRVENTYPTATAVIPRGTAGRAFRVGGLPLLENSSSS